MSAHDSTTTTASKPTNFNKARAEFMRRVTAPAVIPFAFKLAYLLAFKYVNRQTQVAFVSQDRLAADLAVSTRTVRRMLDILKPLGLTIVPGDGRSNASTYWVGPERGTPVSTFSAQKGGQERWTLGAQKVDRAESTLLTEDSQEAD